jgi:hypothetical protein
MKGSISGKLDATDRTHAVLRQDSPALLSTVSLMTRAESSISVTNAPSAAIVRQIAPPKERNK